MPPCFVHFFAQAGLGRQQSVLCNLTALRQLQAIIADGLMSISLEVDMADTAVLPFVQGATPQTGREPCGGASGGPFSWVHLHRRASDASTADSPVRLQAF